MKSKRIEKISRKLEETQRYIKGREWGLGGGVARMKIERGDHKMKKKKKTSLILNEREEIQNLKQLKINKKEHID